MKRLIAVFLVSLLCMFISGCGEQVPALKEMTEMDREQVYELLNGKSLSSVKKKWGDPVKDSGDICVWKSGDRYVEVGYESGKILSCSVSTTLIATVTEISGDTLIVCPSEPEWTVRSADKIFVYKQWFSEADAAKIEVGTVIGAEFDGTLMETYPAQIGQPYAIWIVE